MRGRGKFSARSSNRYLTTGEPVGSRTLSQARGAVGLSPASIRNTMADLASLGLLEAPHAMAGRQPTQLGLRFFVDSLLQLGDVPDDEKREIDARIAAAGANPQDVMGAASDLLSGLAGGAGLVVTPERDAPVRHAEIVGIGPGQALLVLVFEDNQVENRIINTPPDLPARRAGGSCELSQRPLQRQDAGRSARRRQRRSRPRPRRARPSRRGADRKRLGGVVRRRPHARPLVDRARARQSAARSASRR